MKNNLKNGLIICSVCFIFLFEPVFATEITDEDFSQKEVKEAIIKDLEKEEGPLIYEIDIYLLDVSDIDYVNGGYSLSFWITLASDQIDFEETPPPQIDFVNGKIDSIEQHYVTNDNRYTAKVYGTFFTNFDYTNYPILDLKLPIIIEPVQFKTDEIKFVLPKIPSTVDPGLTISGFNYGGTNEKVIDYNYGDGLDFSRFIVTYDFETHFVSAFMIGLFPIIIMAGAVVFLFGLKATNHDIKVEMIVGILIAGIFFHVLDVGESLPPLEYLTLEDKLMTLLYVMLGVIMIEILFQRRLTDEDDLHHNLKIDKKFRIIFTVVVVITIILLWAF